MTATSPRMDWPEFKRVAPDANAALLALSKAAGDAGLDKQLLELMKLRASQINGCAFCLQHHLNMARALKLPEHKLDLLAAWPEAGVYSPREQAALKWTELLTERLHGGVSDEAYAAMRSHFSEAEIALLTSAVAAINAWNRVAVALQFPPSIAQRAAA
jgi:AhpD family alkylhydroperoxidase